MSSPGARLRAFMEARYLELGLGKRHGFVSDMSRRTGVLRSTMHNWFTADAVPRLDALEEVARVLQVARADLVAAFDGTPRDRPLPDILTDGERRRRRKWWLQIARLTTPLNLTEAQAALYERGIRSERGNLVTLWEDPTNRLEPTPPQLRLLADIYRLPLEQLAELWNNPPATDEEEMAARRGARLEEVREESAEQQARSQRRKTA